jgi:hypothetical protein
MPYLLTIYKCSNQLLTGPFTAMKLLVIALCLFPIVKCGFLKDLTGSISGGVHGASETIHNAIIPEDPNKTEKNPHVMTKVFDAIGAETQNLANKVDNVFTFDTEQPKNSGNVITNNTNKTNSEATSETSDKIESGGNAVIENTTKPEDKEKGNITNNENITEGNKKEQVITNSEIETTTANQETTKNTDSDTRPDNQNSNTPNENKNITTPAEDNSKGNTTSEPKEDNKKAAEGTGENAEGKSNEEPKQAKEENTTPSSVEAENCAANTSNCITPDMIRSSNSLILP